MVRSLGAKSSNQEWKVLKHVCMRKYDLARRFSVKVVGSFVVKDPLVVVPLDMKRDNYYGGLH